MESWLSGRKRRSWKPLMCKHPGVRIPNSPPCIISIEHYVFWLGLFFILGRDSTHKGFGLSTRTATSCSRFMLKTCHWQLFLTQSPLTLRHKKSLCLTAEFFNDKWLINNEKLRFCLWFSNSSFFILHFSLNYIHINGFWH